MPGHLIGGVHALWSSVTTWACDRWHRIEERARAWADVPEDLSDDVVQPSFASHNLLPWAMRSIDLDPDEVRALNGRCMREMLLICMACPCRGRCRRDLATGDFARRYRHYCPNADTLAAMAGAARSKAGRA
jgi:hypothetical protein